jgi:hypothetical protein
MANPKPTPTIVPTTEEEGPIAKPAASSLSKFKVELTGTTANVEVPPAELTPVEKPDDATAALSKFKSKPSGKPSATVKMDKLDIRRLSESKDYVRLSPLDQHWSDEMCFTSVPVDGAEPVLHLIIEGLADTYLSDKDIERFRVALASGAVPGSWFLCKVPSQNLTNSFNLTALDGCNEAKHKWLKAVSLKKSKGIDRYSIKHAEDQDFAPAPDFASMPNVYEILFARFDGLRIEVPDSPALLRLRGKKQVT